MLERCDNSSFEQTRAGTFAHAGRGSRAYSPASCPKKRTDRVGQRILAIPSAAQTEALEHYRIASRAPTPTQSAVLGLVPIKYYKVLPKYSRYLLDPSTAFAQNLWLPSFVSFLCLTAVTAIDIWSLRQVRIAERD